MLDYGAKVAIAFLFGVTKFVVMVTVGTHAPIHPLVIDFAAIRTLMGNLMIHRSKSLLTL